jgi:hypothetical protein
MCARNQGGRGIAHLLRALSGSVHGLDTAGSRLPVMVDSGVAEFLIRKELQIVDGFFDRGFARGDSLEKFGEGSLVHGALIVYFARLEVQVTAHFRKAAPV